MAQHQHFDRSYAPDAVNVGAARRFVSNTLRTERADLSDWVEDAAAVVTSELATNAVLHARTSFAVQIDLNDEIVISVSDRDPTEPRRRESDPGLPGGRGLLLLDGLGSSWGVEREPNGGKRVWCTLRPEAHGR